MTLEPVRILVTVLTVWCASAFAGDISARIAESKAAEASPEGREFTRSLWPVYGTAMRNCVPPGSNDPANLGAFVLVGRMSRDGRLTDVEVQPETKISRCFAAQLYQAHFPSPPKSDYPVHIEMKVTP